MALIEFLGVPGVGKTTLARGITEELAQSGRNVVFLPMDTAANLRPSTERVRHLVGLTRYVFAEPSQALRSANVMRLFPQPTWSQAVKTLGYWMVTHALVNRYRRCADILVLDQGFYQGLYSWALLSAGSDPNRVRAAMRAVPTPDILIIVRASLETIRMRLEARAFDHRWVDRLLRDGDQSLEQSRQIVENIERAAREQSCHVIAHCSLASASATESARQLAVAVRSKIALS